MAKQVLWNKPIYYSRDDAKNSMIERLEAVMNSATSERDRETIRNTINTLKSM